jgi:hypothetical protein
VRVIDRCHRLTVATNAAETQPVKRKRVERRADTTQPVSKACGSKGPERATITKLENAIKDEVVRGVGEPSYVGTACKAEVDAAASHEEDTRAAAGETDDQAVVAALSNVRGCGVLVPLMEDPIVAVCSKCGQGVDPLRCHGKSSSTWKCAVCNTRLVQLHRAFGSWPPREFGMLDAAQQQRFFAS